MLSFVSSLAAQQPGAILAVPYVGGAVTYPSRANALTVAPAAIVQVAITGVSSKDVNYPSYPGAPFPLTLAGFTAQVAQLGGRPALAVPVLRVEPSRNCGYASLLSVPCGEVPLLTLQMPAELPSYYPGESGGNTLSSLVVSFNGTPVASSALNPLRDAIHILTDCDPFAPPTTRGPGGPCIPLAVHADGTPLSRRPAISGETIILFALGMGATNPSVSAGAIPTGPAPTVAAYGLDFEFQPNRLGHLPPYPSGQRSGYAQPAYTGLAPGYPGLYQINVTLPAAPADLVPCGGAGNVFSNLTISLVGITSYDAAPICMAPRQDSVLGKT